MKYLGKRQVNSRAAENGKFRSKKRRTFLVANEKIADLPFLNQTPAEFARQQ